MVSSEILLYFSKNTSEFPDGGENGFLCRKREEEGINAFLFPFSAQDRGSALAIRNCLPGDLKVKICRCRCNRYIEKKGRRQPDFKFRLPCLMVKHVRTEEASHRPHQKCAAEQRALRNPPQISLRPPFVNPHENEIKKVPYEIDCRRDLWPAHSGFTQYFSR